MHINKSIADYYHQGRNLCYRRGAFKMFVQVLMKIEEKGNTALHSFFF